MSTPAAASSSPDAPVDLPRLPIAFRGDGWTADEKRHTETCVAHYYHQVLVYGRCWDCILAACRPPPPVAEGQVVDGSAKACLLPLVLAIDFWLAKNQFPRAVAALATARAVLLQQQQHAAGDGNESASSNQQWPSRETAYFTAFDAMMAGDLDTAARILERLLVEYPTDLFALKKVQLLYFLQGDRAGMLAIVERADVVLACSHLKYYHSMVSFAREENDDMAGARASAERALTLEAHDPWAIHDLAHVLFAEGDLVDGARWLASKAHVWDQCMSFLYTHCYFHLALLHLDSDEFDRVESLLDEKVWPFGERTTDKEKPTDPAAGNESSASSPSGSSSGTSFGLALTDDSFPLHDPLYPEDQNAALNLLWRLEIRRTTRPPPPLPQPQQPLPTNASSAADSRHADSAVCNRLDSHWLRVSRYLSSPPQQLTSLYGLLQMYCLFRVGRTEDAQRAHRAMRDAVDQMPKHDDADAHADNDAHHHQHQQQLRVKLEAILLPIARAIECEWVVGGQEGAKQAAREVQAILGRQQQQQVHAPAPPATSTSAAAVAAAPGGLLPSSPPPPLSQPAHLACLAASGEQLEVLSDWYLSLCARAADAEFEDEIRWVVGKKPKVRRERVAWYARLLGQQQQ